MIPVTLTDVKVLDLSNNTPGPFATQILADLGMTILKIEPPDPGDPERVVVPEYFRAYNRGKFSVALDLKTDADRALLHELARDADVVIEGFRPGVTARLGADFETLVRLNPDLIYVSLPGFRSGGEFALEPGHDPEYLARMGAMQFTPQMEDGTPTIASPFHVADYAAGTYAVIGILCALLREPREAIRIEVPLVAAGLAWLFPKIVFGLEADGPPGEQAAGIGVFRAADGRHLTITASEDHNWKRLCVAIGEPALGDDPTYATSMDRRNHPEGNDVVRAAIAKRPLAEWARILHDSNVAAAPVQTVEEAIHDPAIVDLGILHLTPNLHVDTPLLGFPTVRHTHVPSLDEHGDLVRSQGWKGLRSQPLTQELAVASPGASAERWYGAAALRSCAQISSQTCRAAAPRGGVRAASTLLVTWSGFDAPITIASTEGCAFSHAYASSASSRPSSRASAVSRVTAAKFFSFQ